MNKKFFFNIFYGCLLFTACTNTITGGSTETSTKVAGILYNPGGSPAVHAKINIYPINFNPKTGSLGKSTTSDIYADSATTDAEGNYSIVTGVGIYTILASGDSGLAFQDSVIVLKGKSTRLNPDTLMSPGTIKGVVQLQPGDDARTVFISFMGTNISVSPRDSMGDFLTLSMAEGKYRVRIQTTLDNYAVMDTSLSVAAGKDSVLPAPIQLKYKGIPVPTGVRMSYDTARQIAAILWNKSDTNLVKGYDVFRRDIDSSGFGFIPMNGANLVKDTIYIDSTGQQDKGYEYKIMAIDKNDNPGKFSAGVIVTFLSFFKVVNSWGTTGSGPGQFKDPIDIAIAANGDVFIVDRGNKRVQVFDRTMQFKREFSTGNLIPERIAIDNSGNAFVSVEINSLTDYGILKFDSIGIIIDTITIGKGISDLDLINNEIWVITNTHTYGDSISIFSLSGTPKRVLPGLEATSITVEDSNRVWVSSYDGYIRAYDTLGNITDSIVIGGGPFQIAFNKVIGQMFINCATSKEMLLVYDELHRNVARYTLKSTTSEPFFTGIQTDGAIYELSLGDNKIIQIAPLHQ